MNHPGSDLVYAAHTESAIFFLDVDGVCQDVAPASGQSAVAPELLRCIGAQYVASLDAKVTGGLRAKPAPGAPLLLVTADAHMHYALLRTGPVIHFEVLDEARGERPSTLPPPPAPGDAAETEIAAAVAALSRDAEEGLEPEAGVDAARMSPLFQIEVTWPTPEVLAHTFPLTRYDAGNALPHALRS